MPRAEGVLFCGGGTGGHVLPGLAVVSALRGRGERVFRWIGDPSRIEAKLVPEAGIPLLPHGLSRPRPTSPGWLLSACRTVGACWSELRDRPPRAVVALGGYAALIPGLLAPVFRRPLVVLEQNARVGRTNRLLARFSDVVITQFPEAGRELPSTRVRQLGNPVRTIPEAPRGGANRLRVLVTGGSLSARTLNDLALGAARILRDQATIHVIHLAGEEDRQRVSEAYLSAGWKSVAGDPPEDRAPTVEVLGFVTDMPALYARVDLALSRAGATTVAELCSAGIGALYVPLPWAAEDHQTANARGVSRIGGAVVLPQASITAEDLAAWIAMLAKRRDLVRRMGVAARTLARPQAAAQVAGLIDDLSRERHGGRRLRRACGRAAWQRGLSGARR